MKSLMKNTAAVLGLVLGAMAWTAPQAHASDFGLSFNFGQYHPRPIVAPAPCADRIWVPGRYETRTEQVLVRPATVERIWVPPLTETRCDRFGRSCVIIVRPGYYRDVHRPAEYCTRTVHVWVPGYYRDVAHYGHHGDRRYFNVGFNFRDRN